MDKRTESKKRKVKLAPEHGDKFHPKSRTPAEWKPIFLQALRDEVHVYQALQIAGISRRQAYDLKEADPKFADQWAEAVQDGVQKMEARLKKMAEDRDTTAMIFWLKAHDSKYRERVHFEIANKIVESVTLEIITTIKNTVPETCPSCGHLLALGPKIAARLKELSQGLLEKPEPVKGEFNR